jgi:LPXTG-motif cell wall-anchored protein
LVDGDCVPVDEVLLLLVDNSIDCDGFGIAVFAALNDNEFDLDGDGFSSELSPPRLHGAQPELIAARKVQTENGPMVSEIFAVRYVTAVSWTVTHHGISSTNSAGADDARMDPTCPLAIIDTTGVDGRLTDPLSDTSPTSMPVTGPTSTWPVTLAAIAALLLGAGFMILARRPNSGDHEKTITGHKPGSN